MAPKSVAVRRIQAICSTRITVFTASLIAIFSVLLCLALVSAPAPDGVDLEMLEASTNCSVRHYKPDGGDCQAMEGDMRRPSWACLSAMKAAIPGFLKLYERRPIKDNAGGMLADHSFALWYTLRQVQPKIIIESGAFKGHGTWLMRQALPHARIISVDPRGPTHRLPGVEYLIGKSFRDFGEIDWVARGVDPAETLVFLDDHQSGYRRIFQDNLRFKFWRFIAEDNYGYTLGDNMSLKNVCETKRKSKWPGLVQDNFGKKRTAMTWEEHLGLGKKVEKYLTTYYEFPPMAASELTGQKRWDPEYSSTPIVTDPIEFEKLFSKVDKKQFLMYTHFTYVEVDRSAFSGTA